MKQRLFDNALFEIGGLGHLIRVATGYITSSYSASLDVLCVVVPNDGLDDRVDYGSFKDNSTQQVNLHLSLFIASCRMPHHV